MLSTEKCPKCGAMVDYDYCPEYDNDGISDVMYFDWQCPECHTKGYDKYVMTQAMMITDDYKCVEICNG